MQKKKSGRPKNPDKKNIPVTIYFRPSTLKLLNDDKPLLSELSYSGAMTAIEQFLTTKNNEK